MATDTSGVAIPSHLRPILEATAKNLLHHLYGSDGLPWGTSLAHLEGLTLALTRCLGTEILQQALRRQAEQPLRSSSHVCPVCSEPLDERPPEPRSVQTLLGVANWQEPAAHCDRCRKAFFPQSKSLGIDLGAESPGVLRKAIYAASNGYSFAQASLHLAHLAELDVPVKQVERLAQRIGSERIDERDAEVAAWKGLPLAKKFEVPPAAVSPDLAVIMVDGGRMQFRDGFAHANPAPDSPSRAADEDADWPEDPPNKSSHWREDKIGLVMTMKSEVSEVDPCPEIPPGFIDVLRIPNLVRELGKSVSPGVDAAGEPADPEAEAETLREETEYEPPGVLGRQVVATSEPWRLFATMVANKAYLRGAQGAKRKAFVGDGSANNWKLRRRFFGSFEAILDFIHALSYVFAGALAGKPFAEGWKSYQEWIGWVWEGRVGEVIEGLGRRQRELGQPEKGESETSPRSVVASSLGYLRNQQDKMKYHEYRKQGLPITSSLMESGVKQMNQRVKGTEKFWSKGGGEAILQLRADTLCDDEVMKGFWERRQAAATGQRRYRRAS